MPIFAHRRKMKNANGASVLWCAVTSGSNIGENRYYST